MKQLFLTAFLLVLIAPAFAQQQTATELRKTSQALLQQGDLDNAIKTLERAKELEPGNIDVLKDLSYACYIKKDYARAMETGKEAVANLQADGQTYQILGLTYKAIALYKDAEKMFRTALGRFPEDGVLYNEYGEILALDNKSDEAIAEWEKGIRADPSYSSNYYNATKYYVYAKNWLRAAIYGELFVNLESFTKRTDDIKSQVVTAWGNLFAPGYIKFQQGAKTTSEFEKAVLTVLDHSSGLAKNGLTPDNVSSLRAQFIVEWTQQNDKTYPFRLFNHQQQLMGLGYFAAYDQWLFGQTVNPEAYQMWQNNHPKETEGLKNFQQSRVFKIPLGQYYFGR